MSETAEYRLGYEIGHGHGFRAGRSAARTDEKRLKARIRKLEARVRELEEQRGVLIDDLDAGRLHIDEVAG